LIQQLIYKQLKKIIKIVVAISKLIVVEILKKIIIKLFKNIVYIVSNNKDKKNLDI